MLHWKGWGGPEKDVVLGKSPSPPDKMIPNEQNLEPLKRVAARRQLTPSAGVAAEGRAAMGAAEGGGQPWGQLQGICPQIYSKQEKALKIRKNVLGVLTAETTTAAEAGTAIASTPDPRTL